LPLDVYKDWLGIPDGPRPPDHYQLLRLVQYEDAVDKIRANYKKLNAHVRKYATGQYSDESQGLLNELAKAMLCLTDTERKREYDTSLGRVFEKAAAGPGTMDEILQAQGHISADQAREARDHAERAGLDLRDAFVQLKIVGPDIAAQALAQELGLPYVDLSDMLPEDEVLDQVSRATVKQHSILPMFIDQGVLLVACAQQIDHELEDELRLVFGVPVRTVLAVPLAINQAIAKYYAPGERREPAAAKSAGKPADKSTGKPARPAKGEEPPKRPEKKKSFSVRTPEEIDQRRKIAMVIVMQSFFVAYLLDWLLVTPNVFYDKWSLLLFAVIPSIATAIAWTKFWKN
jgi:Type II secretion system (T2SS), protein E, N-terminal domain